MESDNTKNNNQGNEQQPLSFREKYGDIYVVTSSYLLLLNFLMNQLRFLSTRPVEKFGDIVSWAQKVLDSGDIQAHRKDLMDTIQTCNPNSATYKALHIKTSNNDSFSNYSGWFSGPSKVPEKVIEENDLVLEEARVNHLLHQIVFRLTNLCNKIDKNQSCEADINFIPVLESALTKFNNLSIQANKELSKLATLHQQLKENRSDKKFTGRRPSQNEQGQKSGQKSKQGQKSTKSQGPKTDPKTGPKSAPKKSALKKEPVPNSDKPAVNSNPVQLGRKFSDVLQGLSGSETTTETSQVTTETSVTQPAIETNAKNQSKASKKNQEKKPFQKAIQKPVSENSTTSANSNDSDLVQVQMMVMVNGVPTMTPVLMTKSDLSKIDTTELSKTN
jgi:hypothetical protein